MRRAPALLGALAFSSALAQVPSGAPGRLGIGGVQQPPELPTVEQDKTPPPITLPPAAPAPDAIDDSLAGQLRVPVRRFEIEGATVIPPEELHAIVAPYEGRPISSHELRELQDRLTLHYVERGYINSGAIIPDQKMVDGVVRIRIVEGRLSGVEVSGNEHLRPDFVTSRVMLGAGPPLNIGSLQSELLLLQQNPIIDRIAAELVPGEAPGDAVLRVKVEERPPAFAVLTVANDQPPSTGAERAALSFGSRNLTGRADALSVMLWTTRGARDFIISYVLPVSTRDTLLSMNFERTSASVIEAPFTALDIESETINYGVSLTHPLVRTPARRINLGATLQQRENRTRLLGAPFSFVEGSADGVTNVTALRLFQEWIETLRDSALAARSTFSFGFESMGASKSTVPDGAFIAWLGQFHWISQLNERGLQALVRADAQLSNDRLLSMEQFAVGGARTVRGYRENQLVRDNALVVSGELRVPVFDDPVGPRNLQVAAFVDYATTRNKGSPTPDPRDIGSVGLGLRWAPHPRVSTELYWGHRLRKVPNPHSDLQDDGIHFTASVALF